MKIVGYICEKVIALLNLKIQDNTPIYLGETNKEHMKKKHPHEYSKYFDEISNIIMSPDYVAINPKDESVEFVKEFNLSNEHVKIAVRISKSGKFFARSLYVLNPSRVANFISKGTMIKV